jgi:copper(I)-binding protein
VIEAGKMAMLKRGADHIMLMGLRSSWHHGDLISIVLTFEKAGEMTLDVPVDLNRAEAAHSH